MAYGDSGRPAISIVTATYNRSRVLACAIESVRRQTFTDWEMIVVGDACTDDTGDIVARFSDRRVRFINLERNFGEQAGPNNVGVEESTAPLIAFLNHDDLWLPNHLKLCREALQAEQADLVYGAAANIQADSPSPLSLATLKVVLEGLASGRRYSPAELYAGIAPASCWLLRREVLQQLRGWRPARECHFTASQDFMFRAWRAGYRLHALNLLTLVIVASGTRPGSYITGGATEQEWLLEQLGNPALAAELAAATDAGAQAGRRPARLTRTLAWALAGLGINPLQVDQMRLRARPGAGVDRLRAIRGLPVLTPPESPSLGLRFGTVRQSCRVEVGTTVSFGVGRGGARFLASGWSRTEANGVWSDGPVAELLFDFGHPVQGNLNFDFSLHSFGGTGTAERKVKVFGYNDVLLDTWALKPGESARRLRVPATAAIGSLVLIRFRFADPVSPRSVGLSDDPRELAVQLVRLKIEVADNEVNAT